MYLYSRLITYLYGVVKSLTYVLDIYEGFDCASILATSGSCLW